MNPHFLSRLPPPFLRSAFVVALVTIFILAMIPLPAAMTVFEMQDKVEHAGAFVVLMLIGHAAWPRRSTAIALLLVVYGILIEVAQHSLTTNRVGDPWDVVADSVGVALGLLLIRRLGGRAG